VYPFGWGLSLDEARIDEIYLAEVFATPVFRLYPLGPRSFCSARQ
jgi:hypothetical protein